MAGDLGLVWADTLEGTWETGNGRVMVWVMATGLKWEPTRDLVSAVALEVALGMALARAC